MARLRSPRLASQAALRGRLPGTPLEVNFIGLCLTVSTNGGDDTSTYAIDVVRHIRPVSQPRTAPRTLAWPSRMYVCLKQSSCWHQMLAMILRPM